jgi:hypothetical protein
MGGYLVLIQHLAVASLGRTNFAEEALGRQGIIMGIRITWVEQSELIVQGIRFDDLNIAFCSW